MVEPSVGSFPIDRNTDLAPAILLHQLVHNITCRDINTMRMDAKQVPGILVHHKLIPPSPFEHRRFRSVDERRKILQCGTRIIIVRSGNDDRGLLFA